MELTVQLPVFQYLEKNILNSLNQPVDFVRIDSKFILTLSEETLDLIRDKAGELLQKKGFDKNYNLTQEGEILEEIIDLFHLD